MGHAQIWLCAMGHSIEFCYALWAIVHDLLGVMGRTKLITIAQNHTKFVQNLAKFFKGIVRLKGE
jgi:hypothetical protein